MFVPENLPAYCNTRAEFLASLEIIYEFYSTVDLPMRISPFGTYPKGSEDLDRSTMMGGMMASVFTDPANGGAFERNCSTRTIEGCPIPDVFQIGYDLRARLRRAGRWVGYIEDDDATHVLSIERAGCPGQVWDYGVDMTDEEAVRLFLTREDIVTASRVDGFAEPSQN
jgi:hypothetical protein